MAKRRAVVKTEVFVEPGRIVADAKPLRYVGRPPRSTRADEGFTNARDPSIVIVLAAVWAFMAIVAWAS